MNSAVSHNPNKEEWKKMKKDEGNKDWKYTYILTFSRNAQFQWNLVTKNENS